MTLREIQEAVYHLSAQEQARLLETLMDAMNQGKTKNNNLQGSFKDRSELVNRLRGCLNQTGKHLSDRDVEQMRDDRLAEKYLR